MHWPDTAWEPSTPRLEVAHERALHSLLGMTTGLWRCDLLSAELMRIEQDRAPSGTQQQLQALQNLIALHDSPLLYTNVMTTSMAAVDQAHEFDLAAVPSPHAALSSLLQLPLTLPALLHTYLGRMTGQPFDKRSRLAWLRGELQAVVQGAAAVCKAGAGAGAGAAGGEGTAGVHVPSTESAAASVVTGGSSSVPGNSSSSDDGSSSSGPGSSGSGGGATVDNGAGVVAQIAAALHTVRGLREHSSARDDPHLSVLTAVLSGLPDAAAALSLAASYPTSINKDSGWVGVLAGNVFLAHLADWSDHTAARLLQQVKEACAAQEASAAEGGSSRGSA